MNAILDYIGAIIIGGLLMLTMSSYSAGIGETAANQSFSGIVQRNMNSATEILEYDLKQLGYRISDSVKITLADTNRIAFRLDLNDDGAPDSIRYYLGTSTSPKSANPRTRVLYRVVNAQAARTVDAGVTRFRLWYYDKDGNPTSIHKNIRSVKLALTMQTTSANDSLNASAYWERVFKPHNLR